MKILLISALSAALFLSVAASAVTQDSMWYDALYNASSSDAHAAPADQATMRQSPVRYWIAPMFHLMVGEYVAVQVKGSGSGFSGFGADFDKWLETAAVRYLASEGLARNIHVVQGQVGQGQMVLELSVRLMTGAEFQRECASNSTDWRSNSNSRSSETQLSYLTVQPVLYRVINAAGAKEVIAAPASRISASDATLTGNAGSHRYSFSFYGYRGGGWHEDHSEDWSWQGSNEMAQEQMLDGLTQKLAQQTISLTLSEWFRVLQVTRDGNLQYASAALPQPNPTKVTIPAPAAVQTTPTAKAVETVVALVDTGKGKVYVIATLAIGKLYCVAGRNGVTPLKAVANVTQDGINITVLQPNVLGDAAVIYPVQGEKLILLN